MKRRDVLAVRLWEPTSLLRSPPFLDHSIERSSKDKKLPSNPASILTSAPASTTDPLVTALALISAYEEQTNWRLFDVSKSNDSGVKDLFDTEQPCYSTNNFQRVLMPALGDGGEQFKDFLKRAFVKEAWIFDCPWRQCPPVDNFIIMAIIAPMQNLVEKMIFQELYEEFNILAFGCAVNDAFGQAGWRNAKQQTLLGTRGDSVAYRPSDSDEDEGSDLGDESDVEDAKTESTGHARGAVTEGRFRNCSECAAAREGTKLPLPAVVLGTCANSLQLSPTWLGRLKWWPALRVMTHGEVDIKVRLPVSRTDSDLDYCVAAVAFEKAEHHSNKWKATLPLKACKSERGDNQTHLPANPICKPPSGDSVIRAALHRERGHVTKAGWLREKLGLTILRATAPIWLTLRRLIWARTSATLPFKRRFRAIASFVSILGSATFKGRSIPATRIFLAAALMASSYPVRSSCRGWRRTMLWAAVKRAAIPLYVFESQARTEDRRPLHSCNDIVLHPPFEQKQMMRSN
ncbi:hypothetical protein BDZ88DRAFT_506813 [Geranomyces variabilis]|nr:hypothetical protein BDZ88DRAFT_506813 [Geranomyces variabilis]KAJ3136293.1 hypothetical protein HDU90_003345 [Geranomyces variabilis]